MSQLTDEEVMGLFPAEKVVATPAPKYAVGGSTLDDNDVPGFASADPLARAMQNEPYESDLSKSPMMEGGRRKKRRSKRSVRKRKQRGGGKKQPRFQLTMKATVRLRSRQQK
jgi:hypothetical protein